MKIKNYPFGYSTPWGFPNSAREIADGIWDIDTPGHGGYWVSNERLAEMPHALRRNNWAGDNWFEEDCDCVKVIISFPQYFDIERQTSAMEFLKRWKPELWEEIQR